MPATRNYMLHFEKHDNINYKKIDAWCVYSL